MLGHQIMAAVAPRRRRPLVLGLVGVMVALLLLPASVALRTSSVVLAAGSVPGSRLFVATGSNGVDGRLFTADPATGASTLVGSLRVGAAPIGITGLAVHPSSRVLYGSTTVLSPNHGGTLVTIDTATAAATVVGSFNPSAGCTAGSGGASPTMQDIAFRADGTLFGFCNSTLFRIDLATAAASAVGTATYAGGATAGGRGLTFRPLLDDTQDLWVAPRAGTGASVFRINPSSGAIVQSRALSGAALGPFDTFTALTTDPDGTLLGAKSTNNGPSVVSLVAINIGTGAITARGRLPDDTDAIALDLDPPDVPGPPPPAGAPTSPPGAKDRRDDDEKPKTIDKRQRERTNRGGSDDVHSEGDVVGVRCSLDAPIPEPERGFIVRPDAVPYALIANRDDGVQQILLLGRETAEACDTIHTGAYLQIEGVKESEELFEAESLSLSPRR